jgi:uncharacterized protein (UPF0332 family)
MDMKKFFEKGLLKKDVPSKELANKSIEQSLFFLNEANDLINIDKKEMATLALYNAFFHCSRSLLFLDGIKEKSHFAMARYIEEKYIKTKKINVTYLNAIDSLRDIRHETQYTTNKIELDYEIEEYYNLCEELIIKIKKIINEGNLK